MSMTAAYDRTNVFARILRGELPCKKVHEDQFALAFHDIAPLAPVTAIVRGFTIGPGGVAGPG